MLVHMSGEAELLPVRATVHLQGLAAGRTALVDPDDRYIAELLEAEFLVPLAGGSPDGRATMPSTVATDSDGDHAQD